MRIREVNSESDQLIEVGKTLEWKLQNLNQERCAAYGHLSEAYRELSEASRKDEKGDYVGDVSSVRWKLEQIRGRLNEIDADIRDCKEKIEANNRDKENMIGIIEDYNDKEKNNLRILQDLRVKSFNQNANRLLDELIRRMNSGEESRDNLLQSIGKQREGRRYLNGGGNATVANSQPDDSEAQLVRVRKRWDSDTCTPDRNYEKEIEDIERGFENAKELYDQITADFIKKIDAIKNNPAINDTTRQKQVLDEMKKRLKLQEMWENSRMEMNNRKDDLKRMAVLPDELERGGKPVNTAGRLSGQRLSSDQDFGKLDRMIKYDMLKAIQDTKDIFQELELHFIGSMQARNRHMGGDFYDIYMTLYKESNPDKTEQELRPVVEQQVSRVMEYLIPSGSVIAQSLNAVGTVYNDIIRKYEGLTVNEQWGSDYTILSNVLHASVDKGWFPQNCNTPKAIIDHELGHQLDFLVGAESDSMIQRWYQFFMDVPKDKRDRVLSGYAAKNIKEFIAESWAEYRNNPNCRDCARWVSQRIIDLYNNRPQD